MSQFDIGDIDPSATSGTELANNLLEPWRDALHSQHKGSSRPSYAMVGTYWIDDSSTPWQLKLYDGSQDIVIATYDPSNHHVDTIRADVISESSSSVGVTIDNVLIKDGSVGSSGSRITKVWTTELDVDGQFVLGPEHATDSGTDTYDSDTTTTPPDDGDRITRDFQSANTTTTPTLDSKTITDRDGNALWAGAINGVHELQYASGTDTYLLLDPRPTAANVNNAPVARDSSGRFKAADPSADQDVATKGWALAAPGTSSDPSLAFDTWRTPNASRPTLVSLDTTVQTDGTTAGEVDIQVDESGGTTADYSFTIAFISGAGTTGSTGGKGSQTFIVPTGGSYQIVNITDPNNVNAINAHREFTL